MQNINYNHQPAIEICVDSVQSAYAAEEGGARRIELCNSLTEGGTTPSAGLIAVVRQQIAIAMHVLIRPRRGDFLFSDLEFEIMKKDIALAKELGANGVVLGILKKDGNIDLTRMQELVTLSSPMSVTFHRAFDLTPDPFKSLEELRKLKVDRLLTSGQQKSALMGADLIRELITKADQSLVIMPGGGINANNIQELAEKTGATEFHASAIRKVESEMIFRKNHVPMATKPLLSEFENRIADPTEINSMMAAATQFMEQKNGEFKKT